MLYSLFKYLYHDYDLSWCRIMKYTSTRVALTSMLTLILSIMIGYKFIKFHINEVQRMLNIQEDNSYKKNVPTMGGIIIILSTLVSILLFANIKSIYTKLIITTILWAGSIGFIDDYIKVYMKNKEGLHPKIKLFLQFSLGIFVGLILFYNNDYISFTNVPLLEDKEKIFTILPFLKNKVLIYNDLLPFLSDKLTVFVYVSIISFILTSLSNATNLTDGLDGLLSSLSIIVLIVICIMAYLMGNKIYASYLNIPYISCGPDILICSIALLSACAGFLWFNAHPAQMFMGDTGSIMLGSIIAVLMIILKIELLIPLLCAIFTFETISDIIQITYFKYTKKKYGQGKRFFLMAPIHHHYQKKGIPETKLVTRFIVIQIILAIITLLTFKIR